MKAHTRPAKFTLHDPALYLGEIMHKECFAKQVPGQCILPGTAKNNAAGNILDILNVVKYVDGIGLPCTEVDFFQEKKKE